MLLRLKQNFIVTPKKDVMINRPLIMDMVRPRGGWGTSIVHNGVSIPINGHTPHYSYTVLEKYCRLNGIEATPSEMWATLNLDWLSRVEPEGRLVSIKDLVEVVDCRVDNPSLISDWLLPMVDALGFYVGITQKSYSSDVLFLLALHLFSVADPVTHPSTGSLPVHGTLLEIKSDLRHKPIYNVKDARSWFIGVYGKLGAFGELPAIEEHEFRKKYRWLKN